MVSIRLPDSVITTLKVRAQAQGLTVGEYIKVQILKSCSVSAKEYEDTTAKPTKFVMGMDGHLVRKPIT